MARNYSSQEPQYRLKKKKKNGCCTCLLVSLLVFVILIGAGVGVGWYFADQWTRDHLDMKLSEVYSTLSDLDKSSGKGVVTNPYNDSDRDEFYNSIKSSLMIPKETALSADTLIQLWNDIEDGTYEPEYNDNNGYLYIAESLADRYGMELTEFMPQQGGTVPEDQSTAMTFFLALLDLSDSERLLQATAEDTKLKMTDRNLAAFANVLFQRFVKDMDFIKEINQNAQSLDDIGRLRQINLFKKDMQIDGRKETVSMMKATISIRTRDIVKAQLEGKIDNSFANGLVNSVVKRFIPKDFYLSLEFGLDHDAGVKLQVNNMSQKKMNQLFKLINNAAKAAGEELDVQKSINTFYKDTIKDLLDKIDLVANFEDTVTDGAISIPLYDYILDATVNNTLTEAGFPALDTETLLELLKQIRENEFPAVP